MSENNQSVANKKIVDYEINVKCDEALKGLKAVQREARKATEALKQLNGIQEGGKDDR